MARYSRGDYVKVEFPDEGTGVGEWMWIRVEVCDDDRKLIVSRLDSEPLNEYGSKLKLSIQLVVGSQQIREHG